MTHSAKSRSHSPNDRRNRDRRTENRRQEPRYSVRTAIRILRGGDELLHAEILDVSAGGLRFLADRQIEPTEKLLIEVREPSGRCFNLTAVVPWAAPNDNGKWLIGCELRMPLTTLQLALLRKLVAATHAI